MGLIKKAVVIVVGLGVVGGAAVYTGVVPLTELTQPSVSVEDIGDWGDVNNDRIEIIHTLDVQNPNPIEVDIGEGTTLSMNLEMNNIKLGSVEKNGLNIEKGSNSVPITSQLNQDRISEFWSNFINRNETIRAKVSGELESSREPEFSVSTPTAEVTALSDEKPVSDAMNSAADELEGEYTKTVSSGDVRENLLAGTRFETSTSRSVTAGYTIEDAQMRWGEVDNEETEILFDIEVTNSGDIRLPGVPDGIAANIAMNDVRVFEANTEPVSIKNIDRDSVIVPGETKSYTLVAEADNENIEEWFTTYAERNEKSSVRAELQFIFGLGGQTFTAPDEGAIAYECSFQTGIFADNQDSSNTCSDGGTFEVGPTRINQEELTDRADNVGERVEDRRDNVGERVEDRRDNVGERVEDRADQTEEESNSAPTAVASANPQSGEPPLDVTFDGSGSSDSDGSIERYIWQIDGATPGGEGQTIDRIFRTEGEYEATLVTVDDDGARDTAVITVEVEPEPNQAPTAVADASPQSGEAPLDVTFDAGRSSDSDGSIDRYIWQIEGATPGGKGQTIDRTFRTEGEYEATLITVDDDGSRDRATVTVTVERRSLR